MRAADGAARPLLERVELPRASRGSAAVVVLLFAGYLVWVVGLNIRFGEDLTQSKIAERVGYSQMHVSRILRRALGKLRAATGEET